MLRRALIGSLLLFADVAWAETAAAATAPAVEVQADTIESGRDGVLWPGSGVLSGELAGEVKVAVLAEAGLTWRASFTAEGVWLTASAPGGELRVLATPANATLDKWRWEMKRAEFDLGVWWPQLRTFLGAAATGWSASGRLVLTGSGEWSAGDGPSGELRVALREGWARSDALELELSGVEADVVTHDFTTATLAPGQALRVEKIMKAGAEVRTMAVEFGLVAGRVLSVTKAEAGFLGGRVKLRPFQVALDNLKIAAAAEVEGIELAEVAKLMPWAVDAAAGRLRGRIELDWDAQKGLRVRDGGLDIVRVDGAEFRLASSPGMLTSGMPKRFGFFPKTWRLLNGLGFSNPAYAPLKDIEMGREGLRIETLKVTFWPDGVGTGRTATMHVVGRPTGGKLVEEVVIDLNFHGPWTDFMTFGLNQEASYGFRVE